MIYSKGEGAFTLSVAGARYRKTFAADQGQVTFDSVSLPEGEAYIDGEDLLTWR